MILNLLLNMRAQIHEENYEPAVELLRTAKLILT